MPTNSASARSFSAPEPNDTTPTYNSAPTGSSATIEVLIDRTRLWLMARFAASLYVWWVRERFLVFSRTLSNTTTVSYSEKPRIVSTPVTVAGVTSKPDRAYTPTVITRSWMRATMAPTDIFHSRK